jgi:hypothetical protein
MEAYRKDDVIRTTVNLGWQKQSPGGLCSPAAYARHSSSATAIAGEGDHPAKQGGGGGAGLNASQTFRQYPDIFRSLLLATRIFCNGNEAPNPVPPPPRFARYASSSGPPPRYRGGGKKSDLVLAIHPHPSFGNERHEVFASTKIRGGRAPKGANLGPHHRMRRAPIAARSPFGALPQLLLRPCAEARSRPRFTRCSAQALAAPWRRA